MPSTSQLHVLTTIADFTSTIWNDEIGNIYSLIAGGISVNVSNGSITQEKLADAANPAVYFGELFADGAVITSGGFVHVSNTGLNETITGGTAYVMDTDSSPNKLIRVDIAGSTTHTVLDNATNYLDLDVDGTIYVTQSATPATTRMRLLKVVASGGTISSTTDEADRDFLGDIVGAAKPANVSWVTTSTSTITVHQDTRFTDTTFNKTYEITADIVVDITGSVGALGLDQGVEASATWYALVGLGDSTGTNAPSAMLVTAGNYTGSIVLPSTHDQYRRIGWVRNNGSSNFLLGRYLDNIFAFEDDQSVLATGASATFAAVSTAAVVPPTSRTCQIVDYGASGDRFTRVTGDGATTGNRVFRIADQLNTFKQRLNSSQSYDYKTSAGSADHDVQSYEDNRERDE